MTERDEVQELQDLLVSPGWQRFLRFATGDLDERYMNAMDRILAGEPEEGKTLLELRKVAAQRIDRRELLGWPRRRIQAIEHAEGAHTRPRTTGGFHP